LDKNGMTIFKIDASDTMDIICYESDLCMMGINDKKLCRYYKVKPVDINIVSKINESILFYVMSLNEIDKEIVFYNYDNGDSIIIKYDELKEINYGYEISCVYESVLNKKIEFLLDENSRLHKILKEKNMGINNMITYFEKKLVSINEAIKFSEHNNAEILSKNAGKKEIIERILKKAKSILERGMKG